MFGWIDDESKPAWALSMSGRHSQVKEIDPNDLDPDDLDDVDVDLRPALQLDAEQIEKFIVVGPASRP